VVCDCDDECSWKFEDFGEAEFVWVDFSGLACGLISVARACGENPTSTERTRQQEATFLFSRKHL
jgi:hypothetical protein